MSPIDETGDFLKRFGSFSAVQALAIVFFGACILAGMEAIASAMRSNAK